MEAILKYLDSLYPMSEDLRKYLVQILKFKTLRKKDFLLRPGKVCKNIYFIEEGLLRCFYLKGEAEVSGWFMKENDVAISVESFFLQIPSKEYIQALEDTVLYYISSKELNFAVINFPEFNSIRASILEKYYILSEQRNYSMRMHSGAERYNNIMNYSPELVQRVPSKNIASYLGISEVYLSKIKGHRRSRSFKDKF